MKIPAAEWFVTLNADLTQLLIVEDNPGDAFLIRDMLKPARASGISDTYVESLDEAIRHLENGSTDAVLLDLYLPDSYGLDTLLSLQARYPTLPVVILTGISDEALAIQAVQQGAQDYLVKGNVSDATLLKAVRYAIERKKIELELKQRTLELEEANRTLNHRTTQLELTNRELANRTNQLELANQELEAFNYTVSHDLVNPLTIIMVFVSFLNSDYAPQLDERGQNYIAGIERAAKRMERLIQDLLQLAQISRSEITVESVDLNRLAQEIFAQMRQLKPDRVVETSVHPGLTTKGDPSLIKIALENLLGNAWKYTSKQENAVIEFGAVSPESLKGGRISPLPDKHQVYFIRDNGVGFNMQKAGDLFKPFQRFHKPQDFEGTGIGLATVQRIIHRHQGKVWARSSVGQGATFYFTLPKP